MDKKNLINEIKDDTEEIERLIRVLRAYCIDEANEIEEATTMLPALEIVIDKINNIRININKIKND